MKQSLLLLILAISLHSSAQSSKDSTIEQFCILRIISAGSGKTVIDLDYGKQVKPLMGNKTALKDDETGEVKKFNSIADGLNYLGRLGWKLVSTQGDLNIYIFKKEFRATPLE